jgi:L-fucose isomerase-like protein
VPPAVEGDLASEDSVVRALASLRGQRIGAVGDAPPGFTPCLFDAEQIDRLFGLIVEQISIDEAFVRISKVPSDVRDRAHQAAVAAQPSLGDVNDEQARIVAGVEVALDEWRAEEDLSAIAIRCWPEFATDLGACPCSALGRLSDRGSVMTCERDVMGAVTMMLVEALGSGPSYLVDTVDVVEDENLIRVWHCGSAATQLAADPANATQFTHCNRRLGVAGNFPLKTGNVTLVRLDRDVDPSNPTGLRMIVTSGESIAAPNHFQGNTATVRTTADARLLVNGIVTRGFPHHLVIAWADVRPELRRVAAVLGIPRIEW